MSWIAVLFFLIAILYSSVGFGGGSGYLAILSQTGVHHDEMRFMALSCNILVVTYNSIIFKRRGELYLRKVLPLIMLSVPMALIGGTISLDSTSFFIVLGITLFVAGLVMIAQLPKVNILQRSKRHLGLVNSTSGNVITGGLIGFLSGLIGIGGGIFLAPILHIGNWGKSQQIAAASSLFILANSISGITGQMIDHGLQTSFKDLAFFLIAVLFGSVVGSLLTRNILKESWIKGFTAILVITAAFRILVKYI